MGDHEDKSNYGTGWQILNGINAKSEYFYQTAEKLKSYPYIGHNAVYGGGGYFVALKGNIASMLKKINSLRAEGWIDKYTRAVIIDFTIYNAQVNLFASVTYIAEFLPANSIDTYYLITPMNLLGYGMVYVIFQGLFAAIILFLIVKEGRNIWKKKKKYFVHFWSLIDFCIVIFCIATLGIFILRYIETSKLTSIFAKSGGEAYVNFQYVAYWDQTFNVLVGFTEFLATVKFIRLLRFNSSMNMLALTLQCDADSLISFMMVFFMTFIGFVTFFYLIYNTYLTVFLTFLNAMMTCFQMLIGKFNYPQMQKSNPVIGPFIFFIYNCVLVFIMLTMFQAILTNAFEFVRTHIDEVSDDRTMWEYMKNRFSSITGLDNLLLKLGIIDKLSPRQTKNTNMINLTEEDDTAATLKRLPNTIDRLMAILIELGQSAENWDTTYCLHFLALKNDKNALHEIDKLSSKTKSNKMHKKNKSSMPDVEEIRHDRVS